MAPLSSTGPLKEQTRVFKWSMSLILSASNWEEAARSRRVEFKPAMESLQLRPWSVTLTEDDRRCHSATGYWGQIKIHGVTFPFRGPIIRPSIQTNGSEWSEDAGAEPSVRPVCSADLEPLEQPAGEELTEELTSSELWSVVFTFDSCGKNSGSCG